MVKVGILTFVAVFASLVAGAESSPTTHVAAVLWSGAEHFSQSSCDIQAASISSELDSQQLVQNLRILRGDLPHEDSESHILSNSEEQPSAILSLVYPQMSSAQFSKMAGAYSNEENTNTAAYLKDAVASAKSCALIPYVNVKYEIEDGKTLSTTIKEGMGDNVVTLNPNSEDTEENLCQTVMAQVKALPFSTDSITSIIVHLEDSDTHHACMATLTAFIKQATKGNFVAMATSEVPQQEMTSSVARRLLAVDDGGTAPLRAEIVGVKYASPRVLFSLSFMFMFLFVTWIAVYMMGSINSPQRFPSSNLVIPREY